MKRTIRTLTAATMAGAIAFSATPAAHAIDQDQLAGWVEQGLPEAFADEAGNYYRLIGEEYVKSELPATPADLAEAPTFVRNADGSFTFDGGVNVTLGLDFVRTSPDHGTAYDIAGTGAANPSSLIAALLLARDMADARSRA